MRNRHSLGLTITFCLASLVPTAAFATPQDHDEHRDDVRHHRYWDDEHHDYHQWNRGEDRYWHQYWTGDRGPFIAWDRASAEQRRAYWHWRHEREEHEHDRH